MPASRRLPEAGRMMSRHAARGMVWSALESFGSTGVSFVVSLVMARFLAPAEFGLVAMLQIFVAVAAVMTDAGMTQALVRKAERTHCEESTALWLNVSIGLGLYILLYACAPLVARFYNEPVLTDLMRVMCVSVPLNALCVVHTARLTVSMRFDRLCRITGVAVIVSGVAGILLAMHGMGVWALAWQQVLMWGLRAVLLWMSTPWGAGFVFGRRESAELFGFSWKVMGASILDTVWSHVYSVVIGRVFTPRLTGLFWRANTFALLPATTATSVVARVAYPLLSRMRGNPRGYRILYLRILGMAMWIIFPVMAVMAGVASPLFEVLLDAKWAGAVPMFRIICVAAMLYPVHALNLAVLNVAGRSDLFLRLEVIKKVLVVCTLCVTVPFGVEAICVGILANSLVALPINMWYTPRCAGATYRVQLRLMVPVLMLAGLAGGAAFLLTCSVETPWLALPFGVAGALIIYIYGSRLCKMPWLGRLMQKRI